MNKFYLLLVVFLVLNINSSAQQADDNKDYIYTTRNELIYANKVKHKTPFLASNYFLVDSVKYKQVNIKFYNNTDGFFANISKYEGLGPSGFAERVSKGKINLYNKQVSMYNPGHMGPHGMMMGGGYTQNTLQYYNKGFGSLKKAKYKNLVEDLADNLNSMNYLAKYKKNRNIATGLFIAGGAIGIIGLVGFISKTSNTSGEPPQDTSVNTALMISGAGTMMVGSIITMGAPKKIKKAVDAYNE